MHISHLLKKPGNSNVNQNASPFSWSNCLTNSFGSYCLLKQYLIFSVSFIFCSSLKASNRKIHPQCLSGFPPNHVHTYSYFITP